MNNPEKLERYGTQDKQKQNKNKTQYVLDTTMRKQTQITLIRHEPSYKQLEIKTNRTALSCEIVLELTILKGVRLLT